eukprot:g1791.t1
MPLPDITAHPIASTLLARVRARMTLVRDDVVFANRAGLPAPPSKASKADYKTARQQLGKDPCFDLIAPRKVVDAALYPQGFHPIVTTAARLAHEARELAAKIDPNDKQAAIDAAEAAVAKAIPESVPWPRGRITQLHRIAGKGSSIDAKFQPRVVVTQIPAISPVPMTSAWITISEPSKTEDDPVMRYKPYFGDEDDMDILSEVYEIRNATYYKRQRQRRSIIDEHRAVLEGITQYLSLPIEKLPTDEQPHRASLVKLKVDLEVALKEADVETANGSTQNSLFDAPMSNTDMTCPTAADAVPKPPTSLTSSSSSSSSSHSSSSQLPSTKPASSSISSEKVAAEKADEQEMLVLDSYRVLFCRICCTYDCKLHGNKPFLGMHTRKRAIENELNAAI